MRPSILISPSLLIVASTLVSAYTVVDVDTFMYKNVDPIVFPNSYNKSHLHIFFGSDQIKAGTTTSASLRKGCTTASNPNDLSTYWTPTLLYTGGKGGPVPIAPFRFSAYYQNEESADAPFPENLQLLAGNSHATNQSESPEEAAISWYCENGPDQPGKDRAAFPTTACSTHLQHLVFFPDCVDPKDPTYTKATYNTPSNGTPNRCPPGHLRIPRLKLSIRYDLRSVIPKGWNGPAPLALSSGNSYSGHADFFNGWEPAAAQNMLKAVGREFMLVPGPRGKGDEKPTCKPKDQEPNLGTSNYNTSVSLQNGGKRSILFQG